MSFILTPESLQQRLLDVRRHPASSPVERALLTTLVAEIQSIGKNQGNRPTTPAEALKRTRAFLTTAQDNLVLYERAQRTEAADQTREEIQILLALLPQTPSDESILSLIESTREAQQLPATPQSIKPLLQALTQAFGDALDSKKASVLIRSALGLS